MTLPEENPTDDELADLMSENEGVEETNDSDAGVEVGIPPSVEGDDSEVSAEEEKFSMDDFDSELAPTSSVPEEPEDVSSEVKETAPVVEESVPDSIQEDESPSMPNSDSSKVSHVNGDGDVTEFRKSLANLSRQLEIDKLALLHEAVSDSGEKVPSLDQIADDIQGRKSLFPEGDCDQYSKRPAARLDGWISGLSFGNNRRAKKFSK
jgi:hypothetical protein